jgi:predicted ATPase/class 3 adenylate cyclase
VTTTLPSGVVTFLFTDIESSTKLWERNPAMMREALATHDVLLRETIERNHGVVFKTVGDACCSAFEHPRDAVRAAIEAQRALQTHQWPPEIGAVRVRMGIHSGEISERDGDYFGPAVNRVARLMSIAYGDQILASSSTAALVRDALEDDVVLRDLGANRLKDLSRPEPTFQIIAPGLRSSFPALPTLDLSPNNLPLQISSFVGRANELQEVGQIIGECRLLTIAGPGGIGKTRLALQLAAEILERYQDGAWFVDLTAVHDPQFIAQTIAVALGVQERPNEPVETTLVAHFATKNALVVIDNAEQVLADVARLARAILLQCPGVTILATSREPLHIAGEHIYRLGALADDGTRLFMERARQAAPMMKFDEPERIQAAALCKKLEGIPLAIELACARLSSMPLKQLASRLTSGLALSSKDPTESARHRTLRGTIDWSYKLLAPDERAALADLAVFRGGCTNDAVRHVATEVRDIDDAIDSLVDKSLLQTDETAGITRYRLLDVVREYAREQLNGTGKEVESRHARYYAELVASVSGGDSYTHAYAALDADAPNMRAALEWHLSHDVAGVAAFIRNIAPYWRTRGLLTEARSWFSRGLAVITDAVGRAELLCLAASFATLQDDLAESLKLAREGLDLYRGLRDPDGIAQAQFRIAEAVHRQGHLDRAEALYREALENFRVSGDGHGEMLCLGNLGMLSRQRGNLQQAEELLDDARRRAKELGDRRVGSEVMMAMGWVQLGLNELEQSRRLFELAFAEKNDANDRYGVCCARHGIATVALKEGRLDEALSEFLATLDVANELQLKDYVARAFHGIAAIEAQDGAPQVAARFLGLADRLFEESGRELHDSVAYDLAMQLLDSMMPGPERADLRERGARMQIADALDELRMVQARKEAAT